MARHIFFSFHYADNMNANIVRNSGQFRPTAETGFYDKSLWEKARTEGDEALKRLINMGLNNTSVTVFIVGQKTYSRKWCIRHSKMDPSERQRH